MGLPLTIVFLIVTASLLIGATLFFTRGLVRALWNHDIIASLILLGLSALAVTTLAFIVRANMYVFTSGPALTRIILIAGILIIGVIASLTMISSVNDRF